MKELDFFKYTDISGVSKMTLITKNIRHSASAFIEQAEVLKGDFDFPEDLLAYFNNVAITANNMIPKGDF